MKKISLYQNWQLNLNIESPGPTVKAQLVRSDPFEMEVVSRDRCSLRRILREAIRIRDVLDCEHISINKM